MDRNVVFLLGAGASQDAGLPLASNLTQLIVDDLNVNPVQSRRNVELWKVMNFVVAAIVGHRGKSGISPDRMPDIESVVSAIDLLSKRTEIELAPFIQNWDPAVELLDKKRPSSSSMWHSSVRKGVLEERNDRDLEQGLKGFMEKQYQMGFTGGQYSSLMDELLRQLKKQLWFLDGSCTKYLDPLVELGRTGKVTVATLNYDLCVETAASLNDIPVCRGIDKWNTDWELEWTNSGVQLIKLHGSIDWGREGQLNRYNQTEMLMDDSKITLMANPISDGLLPFVIYGKREKLRPEGPFSELRTEFISKLRQATYLVVVGYSFADDHINELIRKWINSRLNRKLVIIDPSFPMKWRRGIDPFQGEILMRLQRLDDSSERKIKETRVLILSETAKEALPKVCKGPEFIDKLFEDSLN